MIISSYIYFAANGFISIFFMAEYYSLVYMYHIFFIHSPVDGHLGCFHVLAIVNNTIWLLKCVCITLIKISIHFQNEKGHADHHLVWCLAHSGSQKCLLNCTELHSDTAGAHFPSPCPGMSKNQTLRSLYEFFPLRNSLGGNLGEGWS